MSVGKVSRVNGQVEFDRGGDRVWSMQQKCSGQEDRVHAGSWSHQR